MNEIICDICKLKLKSLENLEKHKENFHGNPADRTCGICDYVAPTKNILEQHNTVVHFKEKPKKCDICGLAYAYSHSLNKHIRENHDFDFIGYPCDKCEFLGQTKTKIEYHKKIQHGPKDEQTFACEPCGKTYNNRSSLRHHNRSMHMKITYNCEHCDSTFTHQSSKTKHIKEYHPKDGIAKEHKCELCGKVVATNEILKKHLKAVHSDRQEKPHVCPECNFKAKEPRKLKYHIKTVHLKIQSFKCDICEEAFTYQCTLQRHKRSKHENLPARDKKYKCESCDYKSASKQQLTIHINSMHLGLRPYKCETCGQTFTQSSHLKNHCKRIHLKLKNHKCESCDKSFGSNQELNRHVLVTHDDNGPEMLKCGKCEFLTNSKSTLKYHTYQHEETKPYSCEDCGKCFVVQNRLRSHRIGAHTDLLAFPCDFCSVGFKSRPGLKYHIVKDHPEKMNAPIQLHQCDICDYKSIHKIGLWHHKRTHLINNEITCTICGKKLCKTSLKAHMNHVHGNVEKQKCELCDFEIASRSDLKRHVESTHCGIRYNCDICPSDFADKNGLSAHKKNVHQLSCR